MGLHPAAQALHHVIADNFGILDGFAFQNVHRRHGSFNAHRIAAERGGMRSGNPVHELRASQHYAQRHAGGDTLGDGDNVRLNAGVLDGPPFAAASCAALDFIGDKQDAVLYRRCGAVRA